MCPDFEAFRQRLQRELAALDAAQTQADFEARTVTLDQTSVGRLSRMDAMQQQAMAVELRHRQQLRRRRIEAALARVDAGTYGDCCQCGGTIEAPRLDADPTALFCAECIAERESGVD